MAQIEIDGRKVEAEPGSMIIEAADQMGIWIPRFCYHKKLSIAANCRMCLVDVEKSGKPLPACATPITDGMKIHTRSVKALAAQKAVMEFLLINHPLDCPICDQGGECELQDIAMGYGSDVSRYTLGKRVVVDENLGPLIATDMTRCIQCTRCVRFGTEIAGLRELGALGRGEHLEIGTFIEQNVDSEVSGNIIDLCPVGALTSKPFRFTARGWELKQTPSIAPHDCIGSHIFVHSRRQEVMRVVPRENEDINEVWISDRDRFSYEGLYQQRLETPKIKINGEWLAHSWEECLEFTINGLKANIEKFGSTALGALAAPSQTTEEYYLLQKLMRGLGSNHIDYRLRQSDFRDQDKTPVFPHMGVSFKALEQQSMVLLIGSDLRNEQPLLNLKLRKLALSGKKICVINPIDFNFNFELAEKMIVERGDLVGGLRSLLKAVREIKAVDLKTHPDRTVAADSEAIHIQQSNAFEKAQSIASMLASGNKSLILLGAYGLTHPESSNLFALANELSNLTGATVGTLTEGANAAGASLAGFVPHRLPGGKPVAHPGISAGECWNSDLQTMILLGLEPDLDCRDGEQAMQALSHLSFVVALTPFESESLKKIAHVMLPITPFTETSGTFVNAEGQWQSFNANVTPFKESRPAWKIIRVLANLCELEGFQQISTEEIRSELAEEILVEEILEEGLEANSETTAHENSNAANQAAAADSDLIIRLAPVPLYACDGLVRRAPALQKTKQSKVAARMNQSQATQLGLKADAFAIFKVNGHSVVLPVEIDETIPRGAVVIPAACEATKALGVPYAAIEIEPIKVSKK